MKIDLSLTIKYEEIDILFCNIEFYGAKGILVSEIKEKVLYCRLNGFNDYYLNLIHAKTLKKVKSVKLVPIKIVGAANKN